jgi:hypothetical protein
VTTNPGVSWLGGELYLTTADSLPKKKPIPKPWSIFDSSEDRIPVVMVHGFRYDPRARSIDNPHWHGRLGEAGSFVRWHRDLIPDRPSLGFGWYSVPAGFGSVLRAWYHGRYNTYRWAYDLADEAGKALAQVILATDGPCDLLCHSLGSRVVLRALRAEASLPIENIVFMNGAELSDTAYLTALANLHIRFVNLVVDEDDVLSKLGSIFAPKGGLYASVIGRSGLDGETLSNWIDVVLDNPDVQVWGAEHGWALRGDNPDSIGDHHFTYCHEGNRGLIRAALDGEVLDPPSGAHNVVL